MLRKICKMFKGNLVHVVNFFILLIGILQYLFYQRNVGKELIHYVCSYYAMFFGFILLFKMYCKITEVLEERSKKRKENVVYLEKEKYYANIFPEHAKYHEFLRIRLTTLGLDYTEYVKAPSWLVVFNAFFNRTEYMYEKENFSEIHIAAAIMYSNLSRDSTTDDILIMFNVLKEFLYSPKFYNIKFNGEITQLIETNEVVGKSNPDLMLEFLGEEEFAERVRNNCRLYCNDGNTDNMYKMFNDIYSFGKLA